MGFKFKRVDIVAGSEEWPTGNTSALKQTRSSVVVKKCAQAIIDCDCGWALDTTKNATISDTVAIPSRTSGTTFPGLFLTNSTSGCKLFLAYFGDQPGDYGIVDFSGTGESNFRFRASLTDNTTCGLCMSMIPAGSSNVFGDPTTNSFIPSDATRVIGTVNVNKTTTMVEFGGNPTSGYVYSWGLFCTSTCICVSCAKSQSNPGAINLPAYAVGKIFGTLAHSNDNSINSQYGVLSFREVRQNGSDVEGTIYPLNYTVYRFSLNKTTFGIDPHKTSGYLTTEKVCGVISKADGSWINGCDMSSYCVAVWPADLSQTGGLIFVSTNSGKSRWCPYAMGVLSSDLDNYGVVSGDGMKGYLDTDLFRCALGTYGQTYDDGNFICVDGDYDFLIGWDSSNTDQIAGN